MAAYSRVYDSRHLQADCKEPGSAPERATLKNLGDLRQFFSNLLWATFFTQGRNLQRRWSDLSRGWFSKVFADILFFQTFTLYSDFRVIYKT